MVDLFIETLRSLRAHRLRMGLTSLGIVWGVAMLTYLSASMDGYDRHFGEEMRTVGQRIVFLFPGLQTKAHAGNRSARRVEFEMEDVGRLGQLRSIERAGPNEGLGALLYRAGPRTKLIWTWAGNEHTGPIRNFTPYRGRNLSAQDVRAARRVVFLGSGAAERIFGNQPAVGRRIHIESIPFEVVGVAARKGEQRIYLGPPDDEVALIPITTTQRWFTHSDKVRELIFAPRTREGSWEAMRRARGLLGMRHDFRATDETALGSFNLQEALDILDNLFRGLRIFLGTASLITLIVGAVGVMNIMLVVVTERSSEIGLRKAIGASNHAIFSQFLAESFLVTVLSGVLGAGLGCLAVVLSAARLGPDSTLAVAPLLRIDSLVLVWLTLVGVGLFSGILPAIRAARIDPAVSPALAGTMLNACGPTASTWRNPHG